MVAAVDSRFDTSAWDATAEASSLATRPHSQVNGSQDGRDESDEDLEDGSGGAHQDDEGVSNDEEDNLGADQSDGDEEVDGAQDAGPSKTVQPLSKKELEAYQRKQRKKGIIYISSIPLGMTPPKVRHLLSGFGEVERIYLHDGTQGKFGSEESKQKRSSAHYTEGWVEFARKRVAKQVAEILNAQPIGTALVAAGVKAPRGSGAGGSRAKNAGGSRRWNEHVWTMKYLPGFKWSMLTEQMAAERATRTARLRTELAQSALEQKDYLAKVERARIMRDKEARREQRRAQQGGGKDAASSSSQAAAFAASAAGSEAGAGGARDGTRVRTFKQRAPLLTDVRDQRASANSAGASKRTREEGEGGASAAKKSRKKGVPDEDEGRRGALDAVLGSIF